MQLYEHQRKIIAEDKKKCGLFLSTGSAKTRIALLLACGETLVICPKTLAENKTWENEVEKIGILQAPVTPPTPVFPGSPSSPAPSASGAEPMSQEEMKANLQAMMAKIQPKYQAFTQAKGQIP